MNTAEIADFIAGFNMGFTGHDERTYIEGCFKDNDGFETDICTLVADIRTKDNQKIAEAVHQLVSTDIPQLKTFMAACPNVQGDWNEVANWYKGWKAQGTMKVYSTAYRNVTGNMSTIKTDVAALEADWDKADWYDVAVEASKIALIALPKLSAEELLQ